MTKRKLNIEQRKKFKGDVVNLDRKIYLQLLLVGAIQMVPSKIIGKMILTGTILLVTPVWLGKKHSVPQHEFSLTQKLALNRWSVEDIGREGFDKTTEKDERTSRR
uniref:PrgI family protein n=1 Tax=Setaria digitata TaxID=48799 RepID=A0A915PQU0_9BILA